VFQAPGKTVCSEINKPTNFMWNKDELLLAVESVLYLE
jgi:hypothetical protein